MLGDVHRRALILLLLLTTLLILGVALTATEPAGPLYRPLIVGALILSTVGDAFLMFPGDRNFIGGLVSFLVAHLLFVAAFLQGVPLQVPFYAWLVIPYAAVLLWFLLPRAGSLKLPVLVYCAVLGAMVVTAAARHAALPSPANLRALVGAGFFLASDSLLAFRQFRGPYRGAQALILSTYWLAVGLIASSA